MKVLWNRLYFCWCLGWHADSESINFVTTFQQWKRTLLHHTSHRWHLSPLSVW